MNREDIIRMGRQAGAFIELAQEKDLLWLERFATLVAKHTLANIDPSSFMSWQEGYEAGAFAEREACAKIGYDHPSWSSRMYSATIRARGNVATNDTSQERVDETSESVHEPWRDSASDYERGFIDGMQKQMQSSVDKAVNRMAQPEQERFMASYEFKQYGYYKDGKGTLKLGNIPATQPPQRTWVGLTDEEVEDFVSALWPVGAGAGELLRAIEAKLKERNT